MNTKAKRYLAILGTATALTTRERGNTALYLETENGGLLIDCPGSAFQKLLRIGADPGKLQAVIVTHAHPDHIYGLPALIHELWLMGRTAPLAIYANAHALSVARELVHIFELDQKPLPLDLREIPEIEKTIVIESEGLLVLTSPGKHSLPVLAVRIDVNSKSLTYSSDTGPNPALVNLARGSDILIHECASDIPYEHHSTPEEAGQMAAQAGVKELILIHYSEQLARDAEATLARAQKFFFGPTRLASDFEVLELR